MKWGDIYVVNLDRRTDRWNEMEEWFRGPEWPWGTPQRMPGVDRRVTPSPSWFKPGPGAWGCYRSHVKVLEDAMRRGLESYLVLEDDAVPEEGFATQVVEFLERVPDDWDMIYLGGQHLHVPSNPPKKKDGYVECYNLNRTHAFGVSRKFYKRLYLHLHDFPRWQRNPNHHVDHHLGELHMESDTKVYGPPKWLVGQRMSPSDITCSTVKRVMFWHWSDRPKVQRRPKGERTIDPAVVGVDFLFVMGGGEARRRVTGALREMGVHFEGQHVLEEGIRKWDTNCLKEWGNRRREEAYRRGTIPGASMEGLEHYLAILTRVWGKVRPVGLNLWVIQDDPKEAAEDLANQAGFEMDRGTKKRVVKILSGE